MTIMEKVKRNIKSQITQTCDTLLGSLVESVCTAPLWWYLLLSLADSGGNDSSKAFSIDRPSAPLACNLQLVCVLPMREITHLLVLCHHHQ